jgi:hypothetical protein
VEVDRSSCVVLNSGCVEMELGACVVLKHWLGGSGSRSVRGT